MKTGLDIIAGIRRRHRLPESDPIGVVASLGRNTVLKEHTRSRDLSITINTDDLDSDGEVVLPAGMNAEYYTKNGYKFYADHQYSVLDVVGHARKPGLIPYPDAKNPRGWSATVGLMRNPLADAVAEIVRETGQIGASIGFRPDLYRRPTPDDIKRFSRKEKEPERIIERWSLVEVSLTAMPCNVSCQGRMVGDEKAYNELDRLIVKGRISREAAAMLGFPDARPRLRVLVAEC